MGVVVCFEALFFLAVGKKDWGCPYEKILSAVLAINIVSDANQQGQTCRQQVLKLPKNSHMKGTRERKKEIMFDDHKSAYCSIITCTWLGILTDITADLHTSTSEKESGHIQSHHTLTCHQLILILIPILIQSRTTYSPFLRTMDIIQ